MKTSKLVATHSTAIIGRRRRPWLFAFLAMTAIVVLPGCASDGSYGRSYGYPGPYRSAVTITAESIADIHMASSMVSGGVDSAMAALAEAVADIRHDQSKQTIFTNGSGLLSLARGTETP